MARHGSSEEDMIFNACEDPIEWTWAGPGFFISRPPRSSYHKARALSLEAIVTCPSPSYCERLGSLDGDRSLAHHGSLAKMACHQRG